jgi:hypothetical protein
VKEKSLKRQTDTSSELEEDIDGRVRVKGGKRPMEMEKKKVETERGLGKETHRERMKNDNITTM